MTSLSTTALIYRRILQLSFHQRLRVLALVAIDTCSLMLALVLAVAARFEGVVPLNYMTTIVALAPWYVAISLVIFSWRGLYLSLWRYAGIEELGNTLIASFCSTAALALFSLVFPLPKLTIIVHWCMLTVFLGGSRIALRAIRRTLLSGHRRNHTLPQKNGYGTRVLIVGAGKAGAQLVVPLRQSGRQIIGFIDDDPAKQWMTVHGIPVLGKLSDVRHLVERYSIDEVLLAIARDANGIRKRLVEALTGIKVSLRTIPCMEDLIDGHISISEIRPVSIEDLLGREPVRLNAQQIAAQVAGQVVLVTGAGGSIGSELCRQVCRFGPSLLVMVGHGENSIFEAAMDLNIRFPDVKKVQVIADVRDRNKINRVFAKFRPTYVLHAAANKHVHFMEDYPAEAIKTNVFGTQNVAQAALKYGAHKFVMISTDKAVNPTSVMGASKRVAEMVVQSLNGRGRTQFVSVRFGNVLGSRGSVVPIFQKQIAQGGPVTVTHPDVCRYFMTIPEAAQLVLQAAALGKGGEVFVLDMGQPVKIVDLANNLISLSGFRPGKDIQLKFVGLKPGEKTIRRTTVA